MLLLTAMSFAVFSQVPGPPLNDSRDGKVYQTVQIGSQLWMAENLNYGTMVPYSVNQINDGITKKWCNNNAESGCTEYGGFYLLGEAMNYNIVSGGQGICPSGWHVPSYDEWLTLVNQFGGDKLAGAALKEAGYAHWAKILAAKYVNDDPYYAQTPITETWRPTNISGFTMLSGGYVMLGRAGWKASNSFLWVSTQLRGDYFVGTPADATLCNVNIQFSKYYPWAAGQTIAPFIGSNVRCIHD